MPHGPLTSLPQRAAKRYKSRQTLCGRTSKLHTSSSFPFKENRGTQPQQKRECAFKETKQGYPASAKKTAPVQIPEGISRKILRAERHADADLLHAQQVDEAAVLPGLALDLPGLVVALSRSCVSIARSRVALTDAAGWVMGGEGTADGGEKTWQLVTFQDHRSCHLHPSSTGSSVPAVPAEYPFLAVVSLDT